MNPVGAIGHLFVIFLESAGRLAIFAGVGVCRLFTPPFYLSVFSRALLRMGYYSLPVVGMTAIFTGGALALNIHTGGARFNAEQFLPQIVSVGITRELGPVLAALMLAGRVSAAIAAEIGTMRVTEQIDALRTLSVDPTRYLIAPRLLAGAIVMPLLVLVADIIGILGGYLVAIGPLKFQGLIYLKNTIDFVTTWDVVSGLIKASVFGFIIALMGCYNGYRSQGGAQGVGAATTHAVVSAAILIFAANYVLTSLFAEN